MGYKYYIIQDKNGYHFGLFPNNNSQSIGISGKYANESDAQMAINNFKDLIKSAKNINDLFDFVSKRDSDNILRYGFYLRENKYNISFYRERLYWSKYQVDEGISRIVKNIDSPIKYK